MSILSVYGTVVAAAATSVSSGVLGVWCDRSERKGNLSLNTTGVSPQKTRLLWRIDLGR